MHYANFCKFTKLSLFPMKNPHEALRKSREKKKIIKKIHSETITINHNTYIQNYIRQNSPIVRTDSQTSPIPQVQNKYPLLQEMISNAFRSPNGRMWSISFLIFPADLLNLPSISKSIL